MDINDQEISTKRKHSNSNNNTNITSSNSSQDFEDYQISKRRQDVADDEEHENDFDLTLSLSFGQHRSKKKTPISNPPKPQLSLPISSPLPPQPFQRPQEMPQIENPVLQTTPRPLQLSPSHSLFSDISVTDPILYSTAPILQDGSIAGSSRPPRTRRNPSQGPREGKGETVPVLYPWATDRRATVHTMEYLLSRKIETITGLVQCKRCEREYEIGFDLKTKFLEVGAFIAENKNFMHDRAPNVWMNPVLPRCRYCEQENSAKPVIEKKKKKKINWLFLFLGQMLGCCTLEQLKYFCKHTKNHRTGAKDRVLYLAYLALCKQLDPNGPFDR